MAATLKVRQALKVNDNIVLGSATADQSLALATGKAACVADVVIADAFGEDVLWTTGGGGIDTYKYGYIYSDVDIWVQLRNDDTGAAEYVRLFVPATTLAFLPGRCAGNTTDAFDGAVMVDNTDYADVDQIEVARDVAEGVGDAAVSLYLFV